MSFFTFLKSKEDTQKTSVVEKYVPPPEKSGPSAGSPRLSTITDAIVGGFKDEELMDLTLDEADIDDGLVDVEKRKHMRLNRGHILDEDIKLYCRSITTGKGSNGLVLDISPGGLLMVSKGEHVVGEELIANCRIGLNFRMKERIKIRMVKGRKYGAEFMNPSEETMTFLTELYGAVALGRPRTRAPV